MNARSREGPLSCRLPAGLPAIVGLICALTLGAAYPLASFAGPASDFCNGPPHGAWFPGENVAIAVGPGPTAPLQVFELGSTVYFRLENARDSAITVRSHVVIEQHLPGRWSRLNVSQPKNPIYGQVAEKSTSKCRSFKIPAGWPEGEYRIGEWMVGRPWRWVRRRFFVLGHESYECWTGAAQCS